MSPQSTVHSPQSTVHSPGSAPFAIAVCVVLAWGALSFGAVYPWAWWPLAAGVIAVACWGMLQRAPVRVSWFEPWIAAALLLLVGGILVQLVPLSSQTISRLSPATDSVLKAYDVRYAISGGTHPLSMSPSDSWVGVLLVASLAALLLACTRAFSIAGTRAIATGIVMVGSVLALAGIIQAPLYDGKIYGFWKPQMSGSPFGPFVNKNHFAGWMIMGLSLSLGYLCGRIARAMRGVKPGFRNRVLWFASPDASQILLVGMGALVMGLSLVMTMSRSGISCFALAVALTGLFVIRGQRGSRKVVAAGYLVVLLTIAIGWAGVDTIAKRFSEANWSEFNDRADLWRDAWNIATRFMPFGTGFNTYGTSSLFFQTVDPSEHVAEAHSDYLQLLAEGGLLVAIPALLALVAFVAAVRRRFAEKSDDTLTWWIRAGAVTALVAIALQEAVEFSLQIPGNAALFTVIAAIAVARARGQRSEVRGQG